MSMIYQPKLSVIVPSKNSRINLGRLFTSLGNQGFKNFEIIVNDSLKTSDGTSELVKTFADSLRIIYFKENYSMAQARLVGARHANSPLLLHLDSDMQLQTNLIEQCVEFMASYDALVIPEESIGEGYWGKCKVLEKNLYQGIVQMESVRCIKRDLYEAVGGHDPELIFSEDKDLDIRIRKHGARIGRTFAKIIHNEGNPKFSDLINKKRLYSNTAPEFRRKHPEHYAWQVNPINRYIIFLRNYRYLFQDLPHYLGLYVLKTMEYTLSGFSYLFNI